MNEGYKRILMIALGATLLIVMSLIAADLSRYEVEYETPYAHLDTQWQWTLANTTQTYIPNTLSTNFAYFAQYDSAHYLFNFEGAYRFWLVKLYGGATPASGYTANWWTTLTNFIRVSTDSTHGTKGTGTARWQCVGASWSSPDVNIPSPESDIRQQLYGQQFFNDYFGVKSNDIYLPDCFGFGFQMPTYEHHCGLIGFSTQKFQNWGGWFSLSWPIGRWIGVDGSSVIAAMKPGAYNQGMNIPTADGNTEKTMTSNYTNNGLDGAAPSTGVWVIYQYIGTGDQGGGPSSSSVSQMTARITASSNTNAPYMVAASGGQMYDDMFAIPAIVHALPTFEGELVLTQHGTGCLTAWSPMKRRNRQNEQRAALSEFANVTAMFLSQPKGSTTPSYSYPYDTLRHGWWRILNDQFHDVVTGTSIPQVYDQFAVPDEDSAYNDFSYSMELGLAAVAGLPLNPYGGTAVQGKLPAGGLPTSTSQYLTTNVDSTGMVPLVLVNDLPFPDTDVVEMPVNFNGVIHAGVQVYACNPNGGAPIPVPSELKATGNNIDTIVFIASVPPTSFSTYEAKAEPAAVPMDSACSIALVGGVATLSNAYYTVTVNATGDISSIIAKQVTATAGGTQLLSAASRYEMRADAGTSFPAWEVTYTGVTATPTYVSTLSSMTIAESGPARVSLKVVRTNGGSTFTQFIRLARGAAGKRIDVANAINWANTGTLLCAGFNVTSTCDSATYDIGFGTIRRPSAVTARYEAIGQQWADMTTNARTYGVSILENCKYGWCKQPSNSGWLDLTLIHSPSGGGYNYQQDQSSVDSVGIHYFTYSIYGHNGDWNNGTWVQARMVNQPIFGYQATARTGSYTNRSFTFVATDTDQVNIMAIKRAEKSNNYVLRVTETKNRSIQHAHLRFPWASSIASVVELNGIEDTLSKANRDTLLDSASLYSQLTPPTISGDSLIFNLTRYRPRAFSVTLVPLTGTGINPRPANLQQPAGEALVLSVSATSAVHSTASLRLAAGDHVRSISIMDAQGRLVRNLVTGADIAKSCTIAWDGKDMGSHSVRAGVYFISAVADHSSSKAKITLCQ